MLPKFTKNLVGGFLDKSGKSDCSMNEDSQSELDDEHEQTEEEKRLVRQDIRSLYERLLAGREKFTASDDDQEFAAILAEARDVVNKVKGTQEAIEDAKMFRLLCATVKEMSEDANANEKKFHVDEYSQNLGRYMNATTDNYANMRPTRLQWVSLGERLVHNFARVPTLKFVIGALDTEAGEPKERKKMKTTTTQNSKREVVATKTKIIEKTEASEQKTFSLVNSTKAILNEIYRSNGRKPVNYFKFVIDPDSFGNTVENMFHVSFAVKERSVRLYVDESLGLPVLVPVRGGKAGGDDEEEIAKNQAVLCISYQDWKDLKEALAVIKPTIVHPEDIRETMRSEESRIV